MAYTLLSNLVLHHAWIRNGSVLEHSVDGIPVASGVIRFYVRVTMEATAFRYRVR